MEDVQGALIHSSRCWPSIERTSPCEKHCPIHMNIPGYIIAISQGKFLEALSIIRRTNPLPSVCGRICHHPCENACNRKFLDDSLAIKSLKRFVSDYIYEDLHETIEPFKIYRPEKVAIIGSGPAGLTAAHDLCERGYAVTIYESMNTPGGMLTRCIPEFVLPQKVVERDIDHLIKKGVKIKTSIAFGREISLDYLKNQGFKVVILATGAEKNIDLDLENRSLAGIELAIDFLTNAKIGLKPLKAQRILIIGGGNVAVNVGRVARRQGYSEVHLACLESSSEITAFSWETVYARGEGIEFHYRLAPQRFLGAQKVTGVEFRRVGTLCKEKDGRLSWTLMQSNGNQCILNADRVVIAIGQKPSLEYLQEGGIKLLNGQLIFEEKSLNAGMPEVFVAGDIIRHRGTVIEAIRDGRLVARSVAKFLGDTKGEMHWDSSGKEPYIFDERDKGKLANLIPLRKGWTESKRPVSTRIRSWEEVRLRYSTFEAIQEAKRCFNCGVCANCIVERNQICYEQSLRLL